MTLAKPTGKRFTNSELELTLADYMHAFKMEVRFTSGRYEIAIPDFQPMAWRAPVRQRLFHKLPNRHPFEEATTAALCFFLDYRKVRTFMDVGAAAGYFGRLALNYEPHPIALHAFEMQPHYYAELAVEFARAISRGEAVINLAGVSDRHLGKQPVWYSSNRMFEGEPDPQHYRDSAWVRLRNSLRGQKDREAPKRADVTITSIDHYCSENDVAPDMIKIDVDGYEAKVIPGGMETFRRHRPVILLELHRRKYIDRFGVTRRDIVVRLFDAGYRALLIDDHTDVRTTVTPVTANSPAIMRDKTDMLVFY